MAVLWLAVPAAASAQEAPADSGELVAKSLEDLLSMEVDSVYGASRHQQSVTDAPSSVTIVTAEEIRRYGYRTLGDLFANVRSFYVSDDRNYSYIGVRGFGRPGDYNSRVLTLVDGHRVNDNVYDSSLFGLDFVLDIDLIERVEIIRGPSSSLYGASAFFAVVNIITKRTLHSGPAEMVGAAGSLETYGGRASYANRFENGLGLTLSGSIVSSEGNKRLYYEEFDDPATNNGYAEGIDSEDATSLFANVSFRDFDLQASHVSRLRTVPTASYETFFNDPGNWTEDARSYVDLSYEHAFAGGLTASARAYYDRYAYEGSYVYDWAEEADEEPFLVSNLDFASGSWWGAEARAAQRLLGNQTLTLGTEYRRNTRQDQWNFDADPFWSYVDDTRQSTNWALYAQDEIAFGDKVILNGGLRYDHFTTFGGTTNPRMAFIYHPRPDSTVKLLYGQAFRAPNVYEMFYESEDTVPNPELQPETIKTGEVVFEHYAGDHVRLALSGYIYRVNHLINLGLDPTEELLMFQNIDQVRTKGVEVEVEGRWSNGVKARAAYTHADARDESTGEWLTNSPRHIGQLQASAPLLWEPLRAGASLRYISERLAPSGDRVDGFVVTDLTLVGRDIVKGLSVSLDIHNLFDERYAHPGSEEHIQGRIEQNGRTLRFRLMVNF
jgi:iron complex outermembrane receptor protein